MRFVKASDKLPPDDKYRLIKTDDDYALAKWDAKQNLFINKKNTIIWTKKQVEWHEDEQDEGWVPEIRQRIEEQLTELKKVGEDITNIKAFAYLRIYYKTGVYDGAINLVKPVVIYPAPPATT